MQETIRVFVSSTWRDLQPERKSVEEALQRMLETKFVGMEYFGSDPENTQRTSINSVNDCNLYIGIFGGRYGSGITEDEYRSARQINLPCFIYFKREDVITPDKRDTDPDKLRRLADLKEELMRTHTVTDFSTPDELAAKIIADISRWIIDRLPNDRSSGVNVKKIPRRVDAAVPSRASLGQRIDLLVQVRFPDSRLLGLEEWPLKRKPDAIEQASEPASLGFPVNPRTGAVEEARLEISIVAPDFKIEGAASKILDVPPHDFSKILSFLLTPQRSGYCRINIEIYEVKPACLGTVPIEAEISGTAIAAKPAYSVANLYFVVATQNPQVNVGSSVGKPSQVPYPAAPSSESRRTGSLAPPSPFPQPTSQPRPSADYPGDVYQSSQPKKSAGTPWLKLASAAAVLVISLSVLSSVIFFRGSGPDSNITTGPSPRSSTPPITRPSEISSVGFVTGTVLNENGGPIEGARAWIENYEQQATTTDSNGHFRLPTGQASNQRMTIHITKSGFRPTTATVFTEEPTRIKLERSDSSDKERNPSYR